MGAALAFLTAAQRLAHQPQRGAKRSAVGWMRRLAASPSACGDTALTCLRLDPHIIAPTDQPLYGYSLYAPRDASPAAN